MIIVYSMPMCNGCEQLKRFLGDMGVEFSERKLTDAESITDLRMNGCYDKVEALQAPILQVNDRIFKYDALFREGGELDNMAVLAAVEV